jgi:hypothetical protein
VTSTEPSKRGAGVNPAATKGWEWACHEGADAEAPAPKGGLSQWRYTLSRIGGVYPRPQVARGDSRRPRSGGFAKRPCVSRSGGVYPRPQVFLLG